MYRENTNPIVRRIVIKADAKLKTPALIGSGIGDNTDSDVLRDSRGDPYLPGSTLAGVLRSLLNKNDGEALFGSHKEDGAMSALYVLDAALENEEGKAAVIVELDGVALEADSKIAVRGKKYDFEAVETSSKFRIRLMLVEREGDKGKGLEESLDKLAGALVSGHVALGAKTRRGFGQIVCEPAQKLVFDFAANSKDALKNWESFTWDANWKETETIAGNAGDPRFSVLVAALHLDGSIMIRDSRNIFDRNDAADMMPDYQHISSGGQAVIFGTSWAGAIKSGLCGLLKRRYPDVAGKYLDSVFGFVTEGKNGGDEKAAPSKVVFDASFLEEEDHAVDGYRDITRVKIDRFTGGAATGALFREKPWYGGKTKLTIRFPKGDEAIRALLLLALDAIGKGLIRVGGETGVGRGFFKIREVTIDGRQVCCETESKKVLRNALDKLCGEKGSETA